MPSIVAGFEYDIFISYRHNDNRSGWVTEFVKALQEELAATIKEPVSVYFDTNPHDGLLETHNVDRSLEAKLKCLIFIPIISQTYCDTKSFAWQREFVAFNKLANDDQFGINIKLKNGNVTSRILPVKIHELDTDDKTTIENEIGSVLRSIEFIFKSAGVNRALHAHEEHAKDNQNKTFYRDQINKVAHAIKEILGAIKNPASHVQSMPSTKKLFVRAVRKKRFAALIAGAVLTMLVAGYFLVPKFNLGYYDEPIDKSIAVLAFVDMSPTHDQEYLGDGIAEEIINVLTQTEGLKVIARSSSFQFKGKNEDLRSIGKLLGVSTVLQGSFVRVGDQVKVTAQLINTTDGSNIWSRRFDQKVKNIFQLQDAIAREVAEAFKTAIETNATSERKQKWNEEAYRLYQKGRFFYERAGNDDWPRAFEYFHKSMLLDSNQAIVLTFLANCEFNTGRPLEGMRHLEKSLGIDPELPETLVIMAEQSMLAGDLSKTKQLMEQAIESNSSKSMVLRTISGLSRIFGKYDQSLSYAKQAVELDPLQPFCFDYLGGSYTLVQEYDSAVSAFERVAELSPDFRKLNFNLAQAYILANDFEKALREIENMDGLDKRIYSCVLNFKMGNKSKSDEEFNLLKKEYGNSGHIREMFAFMHAYRGETEQAINYLELMHKDGSKLTWILGEPAYIGMHTDPRFIILLKKLKLIE